MHAGGAVASGDDEVSSAVATSALLSRPGPLFCGGLRDVPGNAAALSVCTFVLVKQVNCAPFLRRAVAGKATEVELLDALRL